MQEMYSSDFQWYDQGVYNAIMSLSEKHSNVIPIFGGALGAYNCINCDEPDFSKFVSYIPDLVHSAKFYKWHEGVAGALRTFCHLCLVDPALVELYIGMSFHELCEGI